MTTVTAHPVRTCNEHDVELRQIGSGEAARWVCPRGHSCEVDWTMKPAQKPTTAAPRPEAVVPASEPATSRRRSPMPMPKAEHPHGSHKRYWRGCRCQPCRDAVSKYLRDRKGGVAAPARKRGVKPAKPARTAPRRAKRTAIPADLNLGALAAKIGALRADLNQAEEQLRAAIQATVENIFPGWTFGPSEAE